MFNATSHSDIEDASLAGQDVNVVGLGHTARMPVYSALVSDGCHMLRGASPILGLLSLQHVILNGGEAGARDRTTAGSFDVADGNAHAACSVYGLGCCIAALRAS